MPEMRLILAVLTLVATINSQVQLSNYPGGRRFLPFQPQTSLRRFSLSRPGSRVVSPLSQGVRLQDRQLPTKELGQTSALKSGQDGIYDFSDQLNSILPEKKIIVSAVKPTKPPIRIVEATTTQPQTTPNVNKINIESRIAEKVESSTQRETAILGQVAILHCSFDSSFQVGQYKQAQIWWTKLPQRSADRPIILAAGSQVRLPDDRLRVIAFPDSTFSVLVIQKTIAEDAGDYKCSLPTVTGTKTAFTSLEIKEPGVINVITSAKDSFVALGQSLTLYCRPDDGSLNVWWTAKDFEGNTIEVVPGNEQISGVDLNLERIGREKAGVYTCHVGNPSGNPIRRHFNVRVKEHPWAITAYRNGFNVDTFLSRFNRDPSYGDVVQLRCDSGGIPVPSILWYKDGERLSNDTKHQISSIEPSNKENALISKLSILNFSSQDEGEYVCLAENDSGRLSRSLTLRGVYNSIIPTDDEDRQDALKARRGGVFIKEGSGDYRG